MEGLREVLLATADPRCAAEATGALLRLREGGEAYLQGLLGVLLDEAAGGQLRFLAALYFAQYFRSHTSLGPGARVQLARPLLGRFPGLPHRCRELLLDFLAGAATQGFQGGGWEEAYEELSQLLGAALAAFRADPGEASLQLVCDAAALLVEPMAAYRYVELDDAIATKLLRILACTSRPLLDAAWLLVRWYAEALGAADVLAALGALEGPPPAAGGPTGPRLPLAAPRALAAWPVPKAQLDLADTALGSVLSAMTSMHTLEDFPQFYIDNFRELSTLCACALALTGPASLAAAAQDLQAFSQARRAAAGYFDTLLRVQAGDPLVKEAAGELLQVLAAFARFTLSFPALDSLAAFAIGRLAELCDSTEYCALARARHSEFLAQVVLPAIAVSAEDLERVAEDDNVFTRNFLSGREGLSRRAVAEDLLRALGRQQRDVVQECMRITVELLGALQGKPPGREYFLNGIQALSFYRASVSSQFCRELGVMGPLSPEANFPQFLSGCLDPFLDAAASVLRSGAAGLPGEDAGPAFLLFCAEAVKFTADFRQIIPPALFPAYLSRIAEIVSLDAAGAGEPGAEAGQSSFLVSVLADSLAAMLSCASAKACQQAVLASSDSAGAVQRLLWVFLPGSEAALPSCLLLRGGSGNEFAIAAAMALARYLEPCMSADDAAMLLRLLLALLVPHCVRKGERTVFLHECFEFAASLCGIVERKLWPAAAGAARGEAPGSGQEGQAGGAPAGPGEAQTLPAPFFEAEAALFSLYEVARQADCEDVGQYIFQLAVAFARIATRAAGGLPQRYLRVLLPFALREDLYRLAANVPALSMLVCTLLSLAAPLGDAVLGATDPAPESLEGMAALARAGAGEVPPPAQSPAEPLAQRIMGCCSRLLGVSFLAHCALQILGTAVVFFPALAGQGAVQGVLAEVFRGYASLRASRKFPPVLAGFLSEMTISFGPDTTVQVINEALKAQAPGTLSPAPGVDPSALAGSAGEAGSAAAPAPGHDPGAIASLADVFTKVFVVGASAVSSRSEVAKTITLGLCGLCGSTMVRQDPVAMAGALRALGISSGHSRARELVERGSQEEEKQATSSSMFSLLRALRFSFPAAARHPVSDKEARSLAETHAQQAMQACKRDVQALREFGWLV